MTTGADTEERAERQFCSVDSAVAFLVAGGAAVVDRSTGL